MLKKRAGLISVLATAFVATMAFAGITANQTVASAAGENNNVFVMENGASLKISEDGGIRFRVKMDEAQKNYVTENDNVTLHFLVAPNEFFNAVATENGTYDYYNKLSKKIEINVDETKIYEENGYYWANGCLTNIYAANRNLDFTMLAYTKDGTTINYADAELSNVRGALTDVLSQAVVYTDAQGTSYTEDVFACGAYNWFGTEEYPIQVNNLETYNNLVNKVNGGADFSAYTINVSDKVPTDGREAFDEDVTVNVQNSCVVKFCYADGTLYKKYIVKEGETISVPNGPAGATDQYAFAGWDIDEDGKADKVDTTIMNSATYTAVYEKAYEIMPAGVQKRPGENGEIYRHAFVGLTTDLEVGTAVEVTMEVFVTGIKNENTSIKWVDKVYSTAGGEVNSENNGAPVIVDYATMTENEGKWISVQFNATVRNFPVLRSGTQYDTIDTSAYGNAVYLMASNFMSGPSFNYRNVKMTEVEVMPTGIAKNGGFYQSFVGLATPNAVEGATVVVSMDILATGTVDTQYSASCIKWVDTVWGDNAINVSGTIVSNAELQANAGKWIHVEFEATVRNFKKLRADGQFAEMDVSAYGKAVYLCASQFKSAESFNYKNVEIIENRMPTGVKKSNGRYQSFAVLSTPNLEVGTAVTVEMDVYVTGTYDQWTTGITCVTGINVDNNVATYSKIADKTKMDENVGKWIHIEFEATVNNFAKLRLDAQFTEWDTSSYGNGVYLMARDFLSAASFSYKNVVIKAK